MIGRTFTDLSRTSNNECELIVNNISDHDVKIPPGAVLAKAYTAKDITTPLGPDSHPGPHPPSWHAQCHTTEDSRTIPKEVLAQIQLDNSALSERDKQRLTSLLHSHRDVFSTDDLDIGCTSAVRHRIQLTNETPFRESCRRIPPADYEDTRRHLQELKDKGLIRDSQSPYASPIVLVRKKNGDLRLCID